MKRRAGSAEPVEDGTCKVDFVDEVAVASVRRKLPSADVIQAVADRFDVLSDPTRIRILFALGLRELCVCDLAKLVERSTAAVSHALAAMRKAGLVAYRMDGKLAYYRLEDAEMRRLVTNAFAREKDAA